MALFKNLYLDLKFLNPLRFLKKKKKDKKETKEPEKPSPFHEINEEFKAEKNGVKVPEAKQEPKLKQDKQEKDLPNVPKKLLKKEQSEKEKLTLPKVRKKVEQPSNMISQQQAVAISRQPELKTEKLDDNTETFFSNFYEHLKKEESIIGHNSNKEDLYKNMFKEMQEFWHDKKYDLQKDKLHSVMKADAAKKIDELQALEVEWQRLQLQNENLQDELAHKEILIENNIKQLNRLFKKMHLNAPIHQDHHFILSNGSKLRNLQELVDELELMDDTVFNTHVNEHKNDFSLWIKDVMNLNDLADNIKNINNKEDMIAEIKNWHTS